MCLFGLMAKRYPALVGTFALNDKIFSLWWSDLLQRTVWQQPNQLHCVDINKETKECFSKYIMTD